MRQRALEAPKESKEESSEAIELVLGLKRGPQVPQWGVRVKNFGVYI